MMPIKTTIANILKRSNSFCDGSKYEAKTFNNIEQNMHDSYSTDAIDLVKLKNVDLNAEVDWCAGDFREEEIVVGDRKVIDAKGQATTFRDVSEEIRYKDTVIDELQKSNHELRIKCAEEENKVAQLRLRIEAHCECCSKGLGVEDYTEQKGYNDWSSVHSGTENCHQLNPLFWNSRDYSGMSSDASPYLNKSPIDILNPYVKVKRWQDSMDPRDAKETDSSTGSTYAIKRSPRPISPQNVSARSAPIPRTASPCSGASNDYFVTPLSARTAPGVMHNPGHHDNINKLDKNCYYLRKSFQVGGHSKVDSCEDPIARRLLEDSTKSTQEEWILRSNGQHQSDSSLSTTLNSNDSNLITCDKREQLFTNQFNQSMRQNVHTSWIEHEQNQSFRRWSPQNEATGIVGGLMKSSVDYRKRVPRDSV